MKIKLLIFSFLILVEESFQACEMKTGITECFNTTITKENIEHISSNTAVLSMKHGPSEETITAGTFNHLPKLEKLYLSFSGVKNLEQGCFQGLSNLRELHLTSNELEEISSGVFDSCRRLDILDLNLNKISVIANDAFDEIVELEELDLSSNVLEKVPNLRNLVMLKKLNLGYNKLRAIHSGAFASLGKLTVLKLNDNKLTALESFALRGLRNLRELDVRSNYITSLDAGSIYQVCSRLQKVGISINEFQCDKLRNIIADFEKKNVEVIEGVSKSTTAIKGISCKA